MTEEQRVTGAKTGQKDWRGKRRALVTKHGVHTACAVPALQRVACCCRKGRALLHPPWTSVIPRSPCARSCWDSAYELPTHHTDSSKKSTNTGNVWAKFTDRTDPWTADTLSYHRAPEYRSLEVLTEHCAPHGYKLICVLTVRKRAWPQHLTLSLRVSLRLLQLE